MESANSELNESTLEYPILDDSKLDESTLKYPKLISSKKYKYCDWIETDQKPILRSYKPTIINTTRYSYHIQNRGFDLMHKIMLVSTLPMDISTISEARLCIGPCGTMFKIKPDQFKQMSKFCYELEFVIENNTKSQLVIPLISIQHDRNDIYLSLFFSELPYIGMSEIICEYYQISNLNMRRYIAEIPLQIDTNYGQLVFMGGQTNLQQNNCILSFHDSKKYKIIHNNLVDAYNKNKLSGKMSFNIIMYRQDYMEPDTVENEIARIMDGLSCEFDVYCNYNNELDSWTFYF